MTGIDPAAKEVTACFPDTHSNNGHNTNGNGHSSSKQENKCFTLPYDILVVGVSARLPVFNPFNPMHLNTDSRTLHLSACVHTPTKTVCSPP